MMACNHWLLKTNIYSVDHVITASRSGILERSNFYRYVNCELRLSNTGNIYLQLVVQQMFRCKLRLFVARVTTSVRLQKVGKCLLLLNISLIKAKNNQ